MTSIEWLMKELYTEMNMSGNGRVLDEILEEAKEMHKQEIIYAFKVGYNKAKSTLYTEEQVIGFAEWILNSDSKKVLTRTKESLLKEYIESLKQPKKD